MKKLAFLAIWLALPMLAQTINPNQIQPASTSGYVLTTPTANQFPEWEPVPSTSYLFQPALTLPVSGQYIVIPFGSCVETSDWASYVSNGGSFYAVSTNATPGGSATCSNPVIPSGLNLSDVTAVYGVRYGGWTYNASYGGAQFVQTEFEPSGVTLPTQDNPLPIQQTTSAVLTGTTGSNLASVTATFTTDSSSVFYHGGQYNIPLMGLIVYYTGSPVTQPDYTYFAPPLYYNAGSQTVGLDPGWLANAADVQAITVSELPTLPTIAGKTYYVYDGATSTDCTTGGGSDFVQCVATISNGGASWTGIATGGGSSIVLQTNGTNNTSQALLNAETSTANAVGLTITPSNPSGGIEKWEITGSSYTGNAATSTNLATYPTLCGSGQFSQGLSSGSNNCATPSGSGFPTGTTGGAAYYTGSSGAISSDVLIDQSSIPLQINAASLPTQMNFTYNSGHAPSGVSGSAAIAPDSSGNLDDSENGGSFYRICNSNNYTTVCPGSAATFETNGTDNSSQTTLNLINSMTNAAGLTLTQTNTTGGTVQGEIAGTANTGHGGTGQAWGSSSGIPTLISGTFSLYNTNCNTSGSSALTWTTGTGFGCNTISGGGTPGGSNTQLQYNNSSAFGGISGATSNGTTLFTAGGALFDGGLNEQSGDAYTVASSDENKNLILTYNSGSAVAVSMPDASTSGFGSGAFFDLTYLGTDEFTFTPTTSTINGATSQVLPQYGSMLIGSDGTNYYAEVTPGLTPKGTLSVIVGTSSVPAIQFGNSSSYGIWEGENTGYIQSAGWITTNEVIGEAGLCTANAGYGFLNSGTLIAANNSCGNPGNPATWVGLGQSYGGFNEGSAPSTFASGTVDFMYASSSRHEFEAATNDTANFGVVHRSEPGSIALTGQTAAISTATLCAASAGACNTAGTYRLDFYLADAVSCTTAGSAAVGLAITYTDAVGTKTAQVVPLDVSGALSLASTMGLGTATNSASASVVIRSTGANAIQYATSYTGCTTGTATYNIYGTVTVLQ